MPSFHVELNRRYITKEIFYTNFYLCINKSSFFVFDLIEEGHNIVLHNLAVWNGNKRPLNSALWIAK